MITLGEAQEATRGSWLCRTCSLETPLRGGSFDTRQLGEAEIFFALAGQKADGHDYLPQIQDTSVRLAVVSRSVRLPDYDGAILRVEDPRQALAQMATWLVKKHRPKVVAITGSYGKSTTKEIIAYILGSQYRVLKTPGTYNTEIGVPLTLLDLDGSQDVVTLEYSARGPGDIETLGRIAPPDVAVLLNVGRAHIGVFGTQEAIYHAKGEIFTHLRSDGLAVVGAQDAHLKAMAGSHRVVTFGRDAGDYRAERVAWDEEGRHRFVGVHERTRLNFRSAITGPQGVPVLLAAWAVARELEMADEVTIRRAHFHPPLKSRAVRWQAPGGAVVVDDTYNASPETVANLVEILAATQGAERILVLGNLNELEDGLGESAQFIASHLAPTVSKCLVYAPLAPGLYQQLKERAAGVEVSNLTSLHELIDTLRRLDRPGRVIGIKAARAAHLERAVQGLLGETIACKLEDCSLLINCTDCELMTRG